MPLIEGVGDEVVQFLVIIVILAVAIVAWWSTSSRVHRTVFVMRSTRPTPAGVRVTLRTGKWSLLYMSIIIYFIYY